MGGQALGTLRSGEAGSSRRLAKSHSSVWPESWAHGGSSGLALAPPPIWASPSSCSGDPIRRR
eukprot:15446127-Alexandrium_andersonii.AAC.1